MVVLVGCCCCYRCFWRRVSPKPQYLRCFSSGSKNHGIYNGFWPGPSKNIGIYVVFSMLQEELFPCQRHNILTVFSRLASTKKTAKNRQKVSKMDLRNASWNFGNLFPDPGHPKTSKPQQSGDTFFLLRRRRMPFRGDTALTGHTPLAG